MVPYIFISLEVKFAAQVSDLKYVIYYICYKMLQRAFSHEKFYKKHVKSHEEEITDLFGRHLMGLAIIEVGVTGH